MTTKNARVWKSPSLVRKYLEGVRAAVPLADEQIDVLLRLIAACEEDPRSFLDLGCGDGVLSAAILEVYPSAVGTLLDFSELMIQAARQRLAQTARQLEFVVADYSLDGWTAAIQRRTPFDVVVSGFSIHHQPDERKKVIYTDIHSLLSPGGLFVNIEHVASPTRWVEKVYDERTIDSL